MNSYVCAEKLRVMAGRVDCFANLEATGLKVLRVFIFEFHVRVSSDALNRSKMLKIEQLNRHDRIITKLQPRQAPPCKRPRPRSREPLLNPLRLDLRSPRPD